MRPSGPGAGGADQEERDDRSREEQERIQREGRADVPVQEEMRGAQSAAGGAVEAGQRMERTAGVEAGGGGVAEEENGRRAEEAGREDGMDGERGAGAIHVFGAGGGVLPRRASTALRSAQVSVFLRGSRRR